MKKISFVLTLYNEEEVIEDFNTELFKVLDQLRDRYSFEIIYVLDKSTDGSFKKLKKICNNHQEVQLLALSNRFGYHNSLMAGLDECNGDAVITLDTDLEHPPGLIPELLKKYEEGYEIVYTIRKYHKKIPLFKRLTSNLFHKLIGLISSAPVVEGVSGYRLISKKIVNILQNDIREPNPFLRGLLPWIGFNSTYLEYTSNVRPKGKSKFSDLSSLFNFAIEWVVPFSKVPLKLSIISGTIISILGFLYGFYYIIMFFFRDTVLAGWTTMIVLILFIGGIQLIFLGIIGEYIGAIFDGVKNRPLYIIEERYKGKFN